MRRCSRRSRWDRCRELTAQRPIATCGEFAETSIRAWDLWSSELPLLEERVAELPNALARAAAVQEFLVAKLDPSRCDVLAARVASAILEAGGRVSVSALADD